MAKRKVGTLKLDRAPKKTSTGKVAEFYYVTVSGQTATVHAADRNMKGRKKGSKNKRSACAPTAKMEKGRKKASETMKKKAASAKRKAARDAKKGAKKSAKKSAKKK